MNTNTYIRSHADAHSGATLSWLRLFLLRSSLVCLSCVVALTCVPGQAEAAITIKHVFTTPTTGETFVVPPGVTSLTLKSWGAGGGGGSHDGGTAGGGGYAGGTVSVTPGETLTIKVGGGGAGGVTLGHGGGGGGYSGLFRGSTPLAVAAGGGGGAGGRGSIKGGNAGAGGGTSGVAGGGGAGGQSTGGGAGTAGAAGTGGGQYGNSGSAYLGGYGGGGDGTNNNGGINGGGSGLDNAGGSSYVYGIGGGGGGGRYGGGGGGMGYGSPADAGGGGGGGSSYLDAGVTSQTNTAGSGATAANTGDADYVSGTGTGGAAGAANVSGTTGGNGRVVVSYTVNGNFQIGGTLYRNDGVNAVGAGTTIHGKVGNNAIVSTTTRANGTWVLDVFNASGTTPISIFVNGSSTLKATTFLTGVNASSSVTGVPLYKDTLITTSTTTTGTIDMSKLTFYDFEDDTDVLYHAPKNSTTTVFGNFRTASGTTRAPSSLYIEGGYTNNNTFNHNNGIVTVAGKDVQTGYDLNTTVYDSSFSVSAQDTVPLGLRFNNDGTKLYIVGYTGQDINEYTLTVPYDISTASYRTVFSVATQDTQPTGMAFNPTGTKMYVTGNVGDDVNEYTLSTAFDISTAVYSTVFSVAAQDTQPDDIEFNIDGTKMYITGETNNTIYEYTLSTPFLVTSATYANSLSVGGQEVNPQGFAFSPDGLKMFLAGYTGQDISVYQLTTPFSVSSASYVYAYSVATEDTTPRGVVFDSTGTRMYMLGQTGLDVSEYHLQAPFDLATRYNSNFSISAQETDPSGLAFGASGYKMYITGTIGDDVNEYTLTSPYDVSTASYNTLYSIAANETSPQDITFNTTGTKMFVVGSDGDGVDEYLLATPYSVSTASYDSQFSVAGQDTAPQGLAFNADGTKMYVAGRTNRTIYEYTLSTGFDVSTASYGSNSFSLASQITTTNQGFALSMDGSKMFVVNGDNDTILEYSLSTPFLITSATYVDSFSVTANDIDPDNIEFSSDGTKMFVNGKTADAVLEYDLPALVTGASATLSGTLTNTSALHKIALAREGSKTFSVNASTTSFHNKDAASDVVLPSKLTVKGDYRNGGLVNANNGTVHFTGTTSQAVSGNLKNENRFATALFSGAGVKTFSSDAHVIDMTINSGATVVAPSELTVLDDYSNSGTFTAGAGVVKFASSSAQSIAGTLTGTSAFNDVELGDSDFKNNAVTWTARSAAAANAWSSVTYANGIFVAVAYGSGSTYNTTVGTRVMTSPDGVTWTARTSAAGDNDTWRTVTYGAGLFVAVADSGDTRVMTSPDGITWTARSAAADNDSWRDVVYANRQFVAVSYSGDRVMTSPDGITWTAQSVPVSTIWHSIAYGNGTYVAVSCGTVGCDTNGGTQRVMTSPDGINWTARTAAGDDDAWVEVTYGHNIFTAVSIRGDDRVMTSPDGVTWTVQTILDDNDSWRNVTYGNNQFIAISNGSDTIASSEDGITWTARTAAAVNSWNGVTFGNNQFVSVSNDGTNRVMTSSSGYTPTSPTITFSNNASTSALTIDTSTTVVAPSKLTINGDYENSGTFTAGSGTVYLSKGSAEAEGNMTGTSAFTDVIVNAASDNTWTARAESAANAWNSVAYGEGMFAAVSTNGANRVMTSTNGTTWSSPASTENSQWMSVAYGGGMFAAVAQVGSLRAMTSYDGVVWTPRSATGNNDSWQSITYGNGIFVAVGVGSDYVMTSPDGITWTARTSPESNFWSEVTYGNGIFVAVSTTGTNRVMTSSDGIAWTPRAAAEANQWQSVAYGDGLFVAVADSGTSRVMTSPDGITWTPRAASEASAWKSIAYGNGLFVAIASGGTNRVMTSLDGFAWTSRSASEANTWATVAYGNSLFVAVSNDGTNQVMTSSVDTGVVTFLDNASTTDLTITSGSTMEAPTFLSILSDLTNSGTFTAGTGTTTFSGSSAQVISGTLTGASSFANLRFTGAGTKTFSSNASSTNFRIESGATVVAPSKLSVGKNYTNSGTFTKGSGTVHFDSTYESKGAVGSGSFVYDSSFSVAAQDANPFAVAFSRDGLRMYTIGNIGQEVNEYILSAAFDVSTAAFNTVFSVAGQDTSPNGVALNNDGTKLYVTGATSDEVNEYTLSTAYSLASASYSQTLSITLQTTAPNGMTFNTSGTKMFIIDSTDDAVLQYTLSTPFSVSSATFEKEFSVTSLSANPNGIAFSVDGLTMYTLDYSDKEIHRFALSTAFDVSTAVFLGVYSVNAQDTIPSSITFSTDGMKLFVLGSTNDAVFEYNLPAPFDLGFTFSQYLSIGAQDTQPNGVVFSSDGTKMYMVGYTGDEINEYTLSVPYNVTSAALRAVRYIGGENSEPGSMAFSVDGTQMYFIGQAGADDEVNQYTLSTAWDLNTALFTRTLSVAAQDTTPQSIAFSSDGTKMFVTGNVGNEVNEYTLSTAWNISTASFTRVASLAAQGGFPVGLAFSRDGLRMFTAEYTSDELNEYLLGSAFNLTSVTFVRTQALTTQDTEIRGLAFNDVGTKLYTTGLTNQRVYEYTLPESFVYASSTISGTLTGTSAFHHVSFTDTARKTFSSNASTTNFTIGTGAPVYAPSKLTIAGDYTNSGTFEAGTGTTTFNGTSNQTATGTMTGTSAFYTLQVANNVATTTFGNDLTADARFTAVANASILFPSSATSTFATIKLDGTSGNEIVLRSINSGIQWKLNATTQQSVTYVNVKDSTACGPGIDITATNSMDAGNNTCWNITSAPALSSFANQVFRVGQATTSIESITITAGSGGSGITAANDIRIAIGTTTTAMKFDTTDTTAVFGGTASGKVTNPMSYERNGTVLVIPVSNDFTSGDTLTVSGLSFAQFTALSAPTNALGIRTGGVSDLVNDNVDDKTVAITGTFTVANHDSGQVANTFTFQNLTTTPFFAFKLSPSGESFTVSSLVLSLSGIKGIDGTNISNFALYRDKDNSKTFSAGDVAVGGAGALAIAGQTGTITFGSSFSATTSQNYVVTANTNAIKPNEFVTVGLNVSGYVTGQTSLGLAVPVGSVSSIQHIRGGGASGGSVGGDAPAGQGIVSGGGGGGGEEIGSEPGFQIPTSNGSPFNEWTAGGSAYVSDGVYASTASQNVRQSYSVFGFSVPTGNTVTGIEVKLEASGSTAAGTVQVALSWNGDTTITSAKSTATLGTSDVVYTLGGPADTWGRSWTPAELGNANFFVRLIGQPSSNTVRVDAFQVKPYHVLVGGGGGGGGAI